MKEAPLIALDQSPLRCLLVATMRNEGPFILEWLAYHLSIGFTDVVICSNDCVDGSPDLLARLAVLGVITHLPIKCPAGEKPQLFAYAQAERLPLLGEVAWAMVLDADEFLNVHVGNGRVGDLIAAVPDATAFLVNWRIFGSAGHRRFTPDFVSERFVHAAPVEHGVNLPFKTLFTRIDAYGCKLMPHQPRFPAADRLGGMRYVDGAGQVLPAYFFDETRNAFLQSEPGTVSFALAQVNHYNTRSWEDYIVKHRRGGGLNIAWDREASWHIFDRNETEDRSIVARLGPARAMVASLLEDNDVRRCHERCCELYGRHIEALARGSAGAPDDTTAPA